MLANIHISKEINLNAFKMLIKKVSEQYAIFVYYAKFH